MIIIAVFEREFVRIREHRRLDEIRVGGDGADLSFCFRLNRFENLNAAVFGVDIVQIKLLPQIVIFRFTDGDGEDKQNQKRRHLWALRQKARASIDKPTSVAPIM